MQQELKSFTHWRLALTFAGAVVGAAVSVANRGNSLLMGALVYRDRTGQARDRNERR